MSTSYTTPVHTPNEYTNDLQVWIDVLSSTEFDGRTGTTGATNYALYPTNQSPPGIAFAILEDWVTAYYQTGRGFNNFSVGSDSTFHPLIFNIRNDGFTFSSMSTQFGGDSGLAFSDLTALFQGWSTYNGFSNIQLPPNSAVLPNINSGSNVILFDTSGKARQRYVLSVTPAPPVVSSEQFPTAVFSRSPMPLTALSYTVYPYIVSGDPLTDTRVNFEIPLGWTLQVSCVHHFGLLQWGQ